MTTTSTIAETLTMKSTMTTTTAIVTPVSGDSLSPPTACGVVLSAVVVCVDELSVEMELVESGVSEAVDSAAVTVVGSAAGRVVGGGVVGMGSSFARAYILKTLENLTCIVYNI